MRNQSQPRPVVAGTLPGPVRSPDATLPETRYVPVPTPRIRKIDYMTKVLLAEDNETISEPLARALAREGYEVEVYADGRDALESASRRTPDLVILDVGLPRMDGLDVCRQLRRDGLTAPVLILTARGEEVDTVVGLDAGADDYVAKPFRLAELLARVRALLRRGGQARLTQESQLITIDAKARRAYYDGDEIQLTPKEFDLLRVLMREDGNVIGRDELMREVWDPEWYGSTKTLDMHVSVLRRKLGDDAHNPRHIQTVRGVGFRFMNNPDAQE